MFPWWISWQWVWFLWLFWASVAVDGVWTFKMVREGVLGGPGASSIPITEAEGKNKDVEFGGGLGGSAIKTPNLKGLQYFATQPSAQTAIAGATVVLPCRVINKVGHLQWTKDGFGLGTDRDLDGFSRYTMIGADDEGDFSLKIDPVLLSDDARFQCQVSAAKGVPGIRSPAARLRVYMPPGPPIVEPQEIKATAGMTISVNCTSKGGRPPPEIQWLDDSTGETIQNRAVLFTEKYPDNKRVSVTSQLTFTAMKPYHNSTITCLTSNQALTSPLSGKVQLQVLFPPEVKLRMRPQNLIEGDEVSFVCTANANPQDLTYRWFLDNHQLQNESSPSLVLSNVSREHHEGSVSCEVSNMVGTSKKSVFIQVLYGPQFQSPPEDVAAEAGKKALLECDVDSNPLPVIHWYRQGSRQLLSTGKAFKLRVSPSTTGSYVCVARVPGFPDVQRQVRVLVKGPPRIVSSSDQMGRLAYTVRINCTAISIPTPLSVSWAYRGRQIDFSDTRYEVSHERGEDSLRNLLVIRGAEERDFGPYNCSVVNEYGIATQIISLKKEKSIPVFLVVFTFLAVLFVLVVITSLVICCRRHSKSKGNPLPGKSPGGTLPSGPPVVNMYGAPSDTSLSNDISLMPTHRMYHQLTTTATENVLATRDLNTIMADSSHKSIPEDKNNGSITLTFLEYNGVREYTPLPNGPRVSVNDLGPASNVNMVSMGSPNSTITDLCTIRRGTRGIDLGVKNGKPLVNMYTEIPTVPPVLLHNGTCNPPDPQHSTYSLTRKNNFGSPPPPPYTRGPKLESPRGSSSSTGSATLTITSSGMHTDDGASPEAKYIFSKEAMMKPGTLV